MILAKSIPDKKITALTSPEAIACYKDHHVTFADLSKYNADVILFPEFNCANN